MFMNYNVHKRNFTILTIFKVLQSYAAFTISLFFCVFFFCCSMNDLYTCLTLLPTILISYPYSLVMIIPSGLINLYDLCTS